MSEATPIKVNIIKAYCGLWKYFYDHSDPVGRWYKCSQDRKAKDIDGIDRIFQCVECKDLDLEVGED